MRCAILLLAVGCSSGKIGATGAKCARTADCASGLFCSAGICGSAKCKTDSDCGATEHCQPDGSCQASTANCAAATCAAVTAGSCGNIANGCGGTLHCGCPSGQSCGVSGTCSCAPETDAALCGNRCGSLTLSDNCGQVRKLDCGCTAPAVCGGSQTCACPQESDAQFCWRLQRMCGLLSDIDVCGLPRTVAECGPCLASTSCAGGLCSPLCSAPPGASATITVEAFSVSGNQDIFCGATMDGTTILNRQDAGCSGASTYTIYDALAGAYQGHVFAPAFGTVDEQSIRVWEDGLTIYGVTAAGTTPPALRSFLQAKRSGKGVVDFGPADNAPFSALTVADGMVGNPLLSPDGRFFFYSRAGSSDAANDGFYMAQRDDPSLPFAAAATKLALSDFASGISADDLTLFVQTGYAVTPFTRVSPWVPFPSAATGASIPGFRLQPLLDCKTVLGTCTGGCSNEDTCSIQ